MKSSKWRMPHPATMFFVLTMVVVLLSWIFEIYGLSVMLPQTGEEIRVQSLLSPEGIPGCYGTWSPTSPVLPLWGW